MVLEVIVHKTFAEMRNVLEVISFLQGVVICTMACSIDNGKFNKIFFVQEELPLDTVVGKLIFDNPTTVADVRVQEDNLYFSYTRPTQEFVVRARVDLDSEMDTSQLLVLKCTQATGVVLEIEVEFDLMDINDNTPLFLPSDKYNFSISESATLHTQVGTVMAKDSDRGNQFIDYSILTNPYSNYFELRQSVDGSANLLLNHSLDFEANRGFNLNIIAKDCEDPSNCSYGQRTATSSIWINVLDADDQNPQFDQPTYQATIFEGAQKDTVAVQVRARDQDEIGAAVRYELSGNGSQYFRIDAITGMVYVKDAAGMVRGRNYLMNVKAFQENNISKRDNANLIIIVIATNSNAPQFSQDKYSIAVSEGAKVNTSVLTLSATDQDTANSERGSLFLFSWQSQQMIFSVKSPSGSFKLQTTSANTAVLMVASSLDYEVTPEYNLIVQVSDGSHMDEAAVKIIVINENDHNPQFENSTYLFKTAWKENAVVGKVKAIDGDAPNDSRPVTYTILEPHSDLFSVNNDGEILMIAPRAQYLLRSYALNVQARDQDSSPRMTTVVVYVELSDVEEITQPQTRAQASTEEFGLSQITIYYIGAGIAGFLIIIIIILIVCLVRRRAINAANKLRKDVELSVKSSETMTTNTDTMMSNQSDGDDQNSCTALQTSLILTDEMDLPKIEILNGNRKMYTFSYKEASESSTDDDVVNQRPGNASTLSSVSETDDHRTFTTYSNARNAAIIPPPVPSKQANNASIDSGRSSMHGDRSPSFAQNQYNHCYLKSPSADDSDNGVNDNEVAVANLNSRNHRDVLVPPQRKGAVQGHLGLSNRGVECTPHKGALTEDILSTFNNTFIPEVPEGFRSCDNLRAPSPLSNTSDYGSKTPTPEITSNAYAVQYRPDVLHVADHTRKPWDKKTSTFKQSLVPSINGERCWSPNSNASTEVDSAVNDRSGKPQLTIYF